VIPHQASPLARAVKRCGNYLLDYSTPHVGETSKAAASSLLNAATCGIRVRVSNALSLSLCANATMSVRHAAVSMPDVLSYSSTRSRLHAQPSPVLRSPVADDCHRVRNTAPLSHSSHCSETGKAPCNAPPHGKTEPKFTYSRKGRFSVRPSRRALLLPGFDSKSHGSYYQFVLTIPMMERREEYSDSPISRRDDTRPLSRRDGSVR
jgi:hypothetical protein